MLNTSEEIEELKLLEVELQECRTMYNRAHMLTELSEDIRFKEVIGNGLIKDAEVEALEVLTNPTSTQEQKDVVNKRLEVVQYIKEYLGYSYKYMGRTEQVEGLLHLRASNAKEDEEVILKRMGDLQ